MYQQLGVERKHTIDRHEGGVKTCYNVYLDNGSDCWAWEWDVEVINS